jgi:hypothetical protein
MKTKPPPDRRKFASDADELSYLYQKLLYWLYQRDDSRKARPYAERLERLLKKVDPEHEAIIGAECRSLIAESRSDLQNAIKHRQREIRLINRLYELARRESNPEFMLQEYGYDALCDRLDLMATLYHDSGNLDKAIATLQKSKKLCETHGIKFDGADLLQEYLDEQTAGKSRPPRLSTKRKTAL